MAHFYLDGVTTGDSEEAGAWSDTKEGWVVIADRELGVETNAW